MTRLVIDGVAKATNKGKQTFQGVSPAPVREAVHAALTDAAPAKAGQAQVRPKAQAAKFARPDQDEKNDTNEGEHRAAGEGETHRLAMVDQASAEVGPQVVQAEQASAGGSQAVSASAAGSASGGGGGGALLYVGGALAAAGGVAAGAGGGGSKDSGGSGAPAPTPTQPTNTAPTVSAQTAAGNEDTTITGTLTASDANGDALSYAIKSGTTAPAGFTLNPDGTYSLNAGNAAYQALTAGQTQDVVANFTVSDGKGGSTDSTLTIKVTGTNEAPVFTSTPSSPIAVVEGTGTGTVLYNADASDADNATGLTYSLSGDDAARFTIDAATGEVRFAAIPDFELPVDAGADNVYNLNVVVSDGAAQATQALTVNVTNASELNLDTSDNDNNPNTPMTIDAGSGPVEFRESAATGNNTRIENFAAGDRIVVSGAAPGDYNFTVASNNQDIEIVYNSGGIISEITLVGVFQTPPPASVALATNEAKLEAYLGYDFFQFA